MVLVDSLWPQLLAWGQGSVLFLRQLQQAVPRGEDRRGINLMGFWAPDTLIQHNPLGQGWTHKLLGCLRLGNSWFHVHSGFRVVWLAPGATGQG